MRAESLRERLLTPVLVVVTLIVAVVSSLGAPLIPLIASDFHVSLSDAQWSLTVALLSGAISAPILGRLGDGPHRRLMLICGLGVVTLGGAIAALSGSLIVLVLGRAMQGVGLGLVPLAMAAARDGLPTPKIRPVIALLSVSAAAGVGVGYPVSGLIAEHGGLHAAFWFGTVFSALALLAAVAVIPESVAGSESELDVPGALLLSGGLVALLLAIGQGEVWGWSSPAIVALLVGGGVLIAAWAVQQLRARMPLVDLRLLRHRTVLTADASAFMLGIAMYVNLTVVTTFVQVPSSNGFGFSATVLTAGFCLVPLSITSLSASRLLPTATRLLGPRAVLPAGCLVVAAASAFFALEHRALWEAFATMAIIGVGLGFTFAAIPGLIVTAVPSEETGSAMGFYQVVRYVGFSVGSALTAAILAGHTTPGASLPTESGYVTAAWAAVALCVAAATLAWILPTGSPRRPTPGLERLETEDAELGAAGVIGIGEPGLLDD